jgi:putative redox protein
VSGVKVVEVKIGRVRGALFEATNASGQKALIDGPPELGGQGEGVRPMEMVLMGLAGCSALDVIHILEKQQKEPAVYTDIALHFEASGPIDAHKFERAVKLSMEKYCSVTKMLEKSATITFTTSLRA